MLLVGIGGMFGAISRFLLSKWVISKTTEIFPFATWLINISGSFIIGLLAVFYLNELVPEWVWLLFGLGYLGAYTTFSTFGYETILMLNENKSKTAFFYVTSSVILGVLFAWIGSILGNTFIN